MLLTVTATYPHPATDLGYLLHKNPNRVHEAELPFGKARVFYPVAAPDCCTAAIQIEVDAVGLVRGGRGGSGTTLEAYVNDRPYVCSSFLSVALRVLFGTALAGRSKDRPQLVETPFDLELHCSVVKMQGSRGEEILTRLFGPLGYTVEATSLPLDYAEWGPSRHYEVRLRNRVTVHDALTHIYVLLPVLDDRKHYYVGDDEVDKLLRHGEGWLAAHPDREFIVQRYLRRRGSLVADAMQQLLAEESVDIAESESRREQGETKEEAIETPLRLHDERLDAVAAVLTRLGARRVVDYGCGSGKLLGRLLAQPTQFTEVVGVDVSFTALETASRRLKKMNLKATLLQGSLVYRDSRLSGYDAMALVEVIEHLELSRLAALEAAVFREARPKHVIITTPNREYNTVFSGMEPGSMRHTDHRFEWTRPEFEAWARQTGSAYYYEVEFAPIGPVDEKLGAPSQMAVFSRAH